ncbi:MAG TPA: hypothetical protein VFW70_00955 [Methylomirabilota bacterium]|nr:hypothetical protein [Methylomirabilota bacterium]
MSARRLLALLLVGAAVAAPATAAPPPADLEALRAAQAEAARKYHESLEALLPFQTAAVERAEARLARDRDLVERGAVAAADVAASERALTAARAAEDRTREDIAEAAALVTEAEAVREVAALPPAAPGQVNVGPTLIRHDGLAPWSLAQLPALERFFSDRFRRPLPVSARGQTLVHDRLGFDHREALDVAVHPDSAEGRALMDYLRSRAIPFLAFRSAQSGASTGAHVHIGKPSIHQRGERGSPRWPPSVGESNGAS